MNWHTKHAVILITNTLAKCFRVHDSWPAVIQRFRTKVPNQRAFPLWGISEFQGDLEHRLTDSNCWKYCPFSRCNCSNSNHYITGMKCQSCTGTQSHNAHNRDNLHDTLKLQIIQRFIALCLILHSIITGPPTHSVGGGSTVLLVGICRCRL